MFARRTLLLGGLASIALAGIPSAAGAASIAPRAPDSRRTTLERQKLVLGVDDPATAGNSGLIGGVTLTQVNTQMSFSAIGSAASPIIIANKQFNRKISISGKFYRFINCWFRGEPASSTTLITSTNAGCEGIQFWDCLFAPQNPMYRTNANQGSHHTTYLRCEFRHLADGIAHHNSGGNTGEQAVVIKQCWFHDYWYASPDPDAAGGLGDNASHVDVCLQWRGGGGLYVAGNRISGTLAKDLTSLGTQIADNTGYSTGGSRLGSDANRMTLNAFISGNWRHVRGNKYFDWKRTPRMPDGSGNVIILPKTLMYSELKMLQATSLFMFSPNLGALGAMTFEKNWLDGGACCFNFAGYTTTQGPIRILNNRWGETYRPPAMRLGPDFTVLAKSYLPITITGNVRADTGGAWNGRKNG